MFLSLLGLKLFNNYDRYKDLFLNLAYSIQCGLGLGKIKLSKRLNKALSRWLRVSDFSFATEIVTSELNVYESH
jgi:hypothetical protein